MARLSRDFDPIEPASQRWFYFDYSLELGPSETIASATFTCSLVRGTDPAPASHVLGPAMIVGTQIGAYCGNFVGGSWYSLEAVATTSAGNVLPNNARVYCQDTGDR